MYPAVAIKLMRLRDSRRRPIDYDSVEFSLETELDQPAQRSEAKSSGPLDLLARIRGRSGLAFSARGLDQDGKGRSGAGRRRQRASVTSMTNQSVFRDFVSEVRGDRGATHSMPASEAKGRRPHFFKQGL